MDAPLPIFTTWASLGCHSGLRPSLTQRSRMFDIIELNGKKVAELREIASKLGITRVDKLKKQDLVYSILDEQAAQPSKSKAKPKAESGEAKSGHRRGRGKASDGDDKKTEDKPAFNRRRKKDDGADAGSKDSGKENNHCTEGQ